jgi:O-antigen/teichoic acid export membrane protein
MVGVEFRAEAAAIIPWMALAGLLRGLTLHYIHHAFLLARRTDLLIWLMGGPTVLNIGLNLVLLPRFGLAGAIAGALLSYAVALIACAIVGRQLFPLPLAGAAFAKGVLATGVMAIVVVNLPSLPGIGGLIVPVAVGVLSYGVAAVALDLLESRSRLAAVAQRLVRPA